MGYECFLFAWDVIPKGGMSDLKGCYDTIEEGEAEAEKLEGKHEFVQLMSNYGEEIT